MNPSATGFALTPQQGKFFHTFGYLVLPGLLHDDIAEITRAFEEVFTRRGVAHDGKQRTAVIQFIDQHERLRALLDDPRIEAIGAGLLGEDYNYLDSDGNYYVGDSAWHCDSFHDRQTYLKIALYLDPVRRESGALRVVPGSHLVHPYREALGPLVQHPQQELGIPGSAIPAEALESNPGDVVCFHHTTLHAAFGGSNRRRMFTIDLCQRYPEHDTEDLRNYLAIFGRKGLTRMYGRELVATASSRRRRHLEQVLAHEGLMAPLAEEAHAAGRAGYTAI